MQNLDGLQNHVTKAMTAVLGRQIGAPTPVPAPPGALNFINVLANYPGPTHDLKKKTFTFTGQKQEV